METIVTNKAGLKGVINAINKALDYCTKPVNKGFTFNINGIGYKCAIRLTYSRNAAPNTKAIHVYRIGEDMPFLGGQLNGRDTKDSIINWVTSKIN